MHMLISCRKLARTHACDKSTALYFIFGKDFFSRASNIFLSVFVRGTMVAAHFLSESRGFVRENKLYDLFLCAALWWQRISSANQEVSFEKTHFTIFFVRGTVVAAHFLSKSGGFVRGNPLYDFFILRFARAWWVEWTES